MPAPNGEACLRPLNRPLARPLDMARARCRRHATAIICIVGALIAGARTVRLIPALTAPLRAGDEPVGVDFATIVYGPNVLVAEGLNPWDIHNSVPRFGIFPSSPLWPSGYVFGWLFTLIGFDLVLTIWLVITVVVIVMGARRIALSFDVDPRLAWLIGLATVSSAVALYDVELGQTGAGLVAIVAFFAALHPPGPGRSRLAEAFGFGAVALFLFPKPTFALAAFAAELAYRRRVDWCMRAVAVLAVMGGTCLAVIMARSNDGPGEILAAIRTTARILGEAPVQRTAGDRVDFLSLIAPSPALDLLMVVVSLAIVVAISRWKSPTTFERLFIGTIVTTLLTYHHMYDTMHLLVLALVSTVIWPGHRRWIVLTALVVSAWVLKLHPLERALSSITGIEPFALHARLVFVVGAAMLVDALVRIRRRSRNGQLPLGEPDVSDGRDAISSGSGRS